ncbi:hypothetical protein [Sphingobium sp.]|uniref:hypothetical protein n=1 Tax=Sphingobium sp. TaxID=1912891 RepID=UPI002B5E3472|nr:hypothetical protein [Sphingobium sp.]HUD90543.1 hypothetical protein [Sphingobium sp.]
MSGEVRALGMAHALVLGLLLAAPLVAPDMLPHGIAALFILAGFHLRLADRRFSLRGDAKDWTSHIAMAPTRLLRWVASVAVALVAGDIEQAQTILIAALLCELTLYPTGTILLGRSNLSISVGILALLLIAAGVSEPGLVRLLFCFAVGVTACLVWLRGPDGEPRALALALGGGATAALMVLLLPATLAFALPILTICAAWTLAHLSVLRRRPVPWRLGTPPVRVALRPPLS